MLAIIKSKICDTEDGILMCYCSGDGDTSFPTIELTLSDNVQLTLRSEWYLQYYSDYFEFRRCKVLFKPHEDTETPYWLMGNPFLLSHTTVFDGSQRRIGFSENRYIVSASIDPQIIDETPAYLPKNYTLAVVLIVICGVLFALIIALLVWYAYLHYKRDEDEEMPMKVSQRAAVATTETVCEADLIKEANPII